MENGIGAATGMLAVLMVFLVPIVAIVGGIYMKVRRRQMLHQERMLAMEKGLPPPSDFSEPSPSDMGSVLRRYLHRGLIASFVGVALLISSRFIGINHGTGLVVGGLITLCVGLAYLILFAIENRKPESPK